VKEACEWPKHGKFHVLNIYYSLFTAMHLPSAALLCIKLRMYPHQVTKHFFGKQTMLLCRPDSIAVQETFRLQKEKNPDASAPYWAQVWPAALGMCQVLAAHPHYVQDKTVLEIAGGLGLPSLLASRFAKTVHCTDAAAEVLPYIEQSVQLNHCANMHCSQLYWQQAAAEQANVLLLSDVNYNPADFDTLWQLFQFWMAQGTAILLSTPQRLMAKPFIDRLLPFCKKHFVETVETDGQNTMVTVLVLQH
jgi:predicted nicotinamide N-methyase